MRGLLMLLALAPLLLAPPLRAQRLPQGSRALEGVPQQSCGFGEGLAQLREVEREAARPVPGIAEGRARGEQAIAALSSASGIFRGCGCARLAEMTAEARQVAAPAPSEASVPRLTAVFAQVRFRAQLAREFTEERGCR